MIETQMESGRVERLDLQQLGENWIRSIMEGRLEQLEQFCHPQINSQLLTPKRFTTLEQAGDLLAKYRQWFGECTDFHLESSRVCQVGERLGIYYRFTLLEQGSWYTIEQQLYCTINDGRVDQLHLLCSGFQRIEKNDRLDGLQPSHPSHETRPGDGLLEVYTGTPETSSTCAVLTPAIRSKLCEMQSGQVLEVRVDDASARGDIEAWCRLSGNELMNVIDDEGKILRFFVRKK